MVMIGMSDNSSLENQHLIDLFALNTSSGIPIYRQLVDQIKQAVLMELLLANQQLPSVRQLAKALQINPMTISKAFAQLELEKVLVRKRGVGMLVAEPQTHAEIPTQITESLRDLIKLSRDHRLSDEAIMTLVQQALSIKLKGTNS
jgi:GntR family transcriptional regulator